MNEQACKSKFSVAPKQVQIEITTRCNLACVMCPHGIGAMKSTIDAPRISWTAFWE